MKAGYYAVLEYRNLIRSDLTCGDELYARSLDTLNKKIARWKTDRINPIWKRRVKSKYKIEKI